MSAPLYTPAAFRVTDQDQVAAWIRQYDFATLISASPAAFHLSHLPLMLSTDGKTLTGHLAAANPHAGALADGAMVTALFHGPHGYVSPTWYCDTHSNIPNVPTWNYIAVHAHGTIRRIDDAEGKWRIVEVLSAQYEAGNATRWLAGEMGAHASKLDAIVGFEIAIHAIEAKAKLSQNRSAADRESVIAALQKSPLSSNHELAAAMSKTFKRELP